MSPLIISFDVFTFPRLLQIAGLSLKVASTLCQKSELEYWDFFRSDIFARISVFPRFSQMARLCIKGKSTESLAC